MYVRILMTLALTIASMPGGASAEGDPSNGRDLARSNCARCHGADGNARSTSFQPVPMLAGQPAVYLVQEMKNYATGARTDSSKGSAMTRFLKNLSDQDLQDIAAYFEAQKRY
jgi:cytochrome c553